MFLLGGWEQIIKQSLFMADFSESDPATTLKTAIFVTLLQSEAFQHKKNYHGIKT